MDTKERIRLAIITTHPIQYQAPVWRYLAVFPEFEMRVFFASDFSVRGYKDRQFGVSFKWDQPLTVGYDYEFLGHDVKAGFFSMDGRRLRQSLEEFRPDVGLVCGYFPKYFPDAILQLKRMGAKVMMRAELTDADRSRNFLKGLARDIVIGALYNKVDHFISIGERCRRHLKRMKVLDSRISFGGYNVDNDLFEHQFVENVPRRNELRTELGVGQDEFVFLVCGKMIPKKNPLLVAKAFKQLNAANTQQKMRLIFLGDGELKEETLYASGNTAYGSVMVTGFINQGELGKYYAISDCAILPSSFGETWGLVVNEAQIFGLPVIVSDRVGCFLDLVTPETGRVFPSGDLDALVDAMQTAIPWVQNNRDTIAIASRAKARNYTAQKAAKAIALAALIVGKKK
jgi:glycosyltransferase involved in cell wall biosynthesis